MDLVSAIDILKKDKEAMDLVIKLGNGTPQMEDLVEATDVVIDWVDKMYLALIQLGK